MEVKKVASYALYRHPASAYESERAGAGRGRFFAGYLPALVRAHLSVFHPEGWQMELRHDWKAKAFEYWPVIEKLWVQGLLDLHFMVRADTLCGSMLWRMMPLWDDKTDVFICRDIDSLPTVRDLKAVDHWLEKGEAGIHAMHDSPSHSSASLLGGMVGFRKDKVARPTATFADFLLTAAGLTDLNQHGADQIVLRMLFGRERVHNDTTETLPKPEDPRDSCDGYARHIGGAYHAGPVAAWYDKTGQTHPAILEAEKEVFGKPCGA